MISQPLNIIARLFIALTAMGLIAGCATSSPTPQPGREVVERPRSPTVGERAADIALQQVGVPYRYGGNTAQGFDCSGLVQFSYGKAGKSVPRTTGQLWSAATTVDRANLRQGDLLFFSIEGKMAHVGIYVGRNQFVHAPSSGRTVTVERLDAPFYRQALLRAGRP